MPDTPHPQEWIKGRKYDAVGIATFGPVDPKLSSPTYGYITTTPKPGWKVREPDNERGRLTICLSV